MTTAIFKKTIKPREIEEFLDYYFYRRIAARLVPLLIDLQLTPTHVTFISLAWGLLAAISVYQQQFITAAFYSILAMIFDCCDGQVARLTKTTSPLGRARDGLCDFIWVSAFWVCLLKSGYFQSKEISILWLLILSAISMIIHVWRFDAVKVRYFELAKPEALEGDMDVPTAVALFKELVRKGKIVDAHICMALIIQAYLFVHGSKKKTVYKLRENQKKQIREVMQPVIKKWSYLGEGHHNSLVVFGLFFASLTPFPLVLAFVTISVALNFYWLYCEWLFHKAYRSIENHLPKSTQQSSDNIQIS